jgi:hypothetical protein
MSVLFSIVISLMARGEKPEATHQPIAHKKHEKENLILKFQKGKV